MVTLSAVQERCRDEAIEILSNKGMVLLCMKTRTGKTFTSFAVVQHFGYKRAAFITKKECVRDIRNQAGKFNCTFKIDVINHESAHKLDPDNYDIVIVDECHALGAYPKTTQRWVKVRMLCSGKPVIYLSATPTPEHLPSMYHEFALCDYSPWRNYQNFYRWADDYVDKRMIERYGRPTTCYDDGKEDKIMDDVRPYTVNATQEEAGIKAPVSERFVYVEMSAYTKALFKCMAENSYIIKGRDHLNLEIVEAGAAAQVKSKMHQIASGTLKNATVTWTTDKTKAYCMRNDALWQGYKKIAIFYKYVQEKVIIKECLEKYYKIYEDYIDFQECEHGVYISQIISGREGIRIDTAEALYFYNIDFAFLSYEQAKNRIQSIDREMEPVIVWMFSTLGLEDSIYYHTVKRKQKYTTIHYRKFIRSIK